MSTEITPPNNDGPKSLLTRFLDVIEWAGNKLPDPAVLFLIALVITWVLSWPLSNVEFSYDDPRVKAAPTQAAKKIEITNLLTATQLVTFLTVMVTEFTSFKPLGIVLVAMLGVGVAEYTGFINALVKGMLKITPNKLLTPMVLLVAIVSHTAGDTGYVVVIPLAGIIFAAAGRHPVAGIVCAFAGVSGGFSANFIPSGLDPLLQGFTQTAANILEPDRQVGVLCNYLFMTASCLLIVAVGWVLTDYVIEPKLKGSPVDGDPEDMPVMEELTDTEWRGMIAGLIAFGVLVVLLIAVCIPETSPMRLQVENLPADKAAKLKANDNSLIVFDAPLMKSIVPLIFLFFLVPGIVYGYMAGTVKNHRDIIKGMSKAMSTMGYYMVMAFFAAQFLYAFRVSNIGILLAVSGADFLQSLNLPPQITVVGILLLAATVNLLVGSASAKWALLGPIFVPMLMPLHISPELTQAAYRIGDSSTNIITPLMPYFPLIVVYAQRYVKGTGIGTLISMMLPYAVCFLLTWTVLLLIFWQLQLPLGLPLNVEYYPR